MRLVIAIALLTLVGGPAEPAAAQGRTQPPERRLTRPEASYREPFSMIIGVRELPDGRVVVSDPIEQALLRIDLATGRAEPLGRVGEGPGEYRSPDRLFALPDGATLVTDLGNGRLSVFGADGRYRESVPIVVGTPGGGPGPGDGPGRPTFLLATQSDAQGRLYFQPFGAPGGRPVDSAAVARYDRRSGRIDTVAFVKIAPPVERSSGSDNDRRVMLMPPAFPRQDGWAVAPDGRIAIVRAADYRVEWVTPAGRVVGQPVAFRPVPIRDADRQEWLDASGSGLRVGVENRNGEITTTFNRGRSGRGAESQPDITWPSARPPFVPGSPLVTPEGELWVERSVPAGSAREYDTFDGRGTHTGRVILPVGQRVIAFGRGTVYVVRRDADDLQYLERYRR